jgi:2'-5' RNA ligase
MVSSGQQAETAGMASCVLYCKQGGLHMSVLYTCCHTASEIRQLHERLANLEWKSFEIDYSDAGCNVDMHEPDKVYLHAMPDSKGQQQLLDLTKKINAAMADGGLKVNHPRKSKFHMTLARVTRRYPADAAVAAIKRMVFSDAGLRLRLCKFELDGKEYKASDSLNCL